MLGTNDFQFCHPYNNAWAAAQGVTALVNEIRRAPDRARHARAPHSDWLPAADPLAARPGSGDFLAPNNARRGPAAAAERNPPLPRPRADRRWATNKNGGTGVASHQHAANLIHQRGHSLRGGPSVVVGMAELKIVRTPRAYHQRHGDCASFSLQPSPPNPLRPALNGLPVPHRAPARKQCSVTRTLCPLASSLLSHHARPSGRRTETARRCGHDAQVSESP